MYSPGRKGVSSRLLGLPRLQWLVSPQQFPERLLESCGRVARNGIGQTLITQDEQFTLTLHEVYGGACPSPQASPPPGRNPGSSQPVAGVPAQQRPQHLILQRRTAQVRLFAAQQLRDVGKKTGPNGADQGCSGHAHPSLSRIQARDRRPGTGSTRGRQRVAYVVPMVIAPEVPQVLQVPSLAFPVRPKPECQFARERLSLKWWVHAESGP